MMMMQIAIVEIEISEFGMATLRTPPPLTTAPMIAKVTPALMLPKTMLVMKPASSNCFLSDTRKCSIDIRCRSERRGDCFDVFYTGYTISIYLDPPDEDAQSPISLCTLVSIGLRPNNISTTAWHRNSIHIIHSIGTNDN